MAFTSHIFFFLFAPLFKQYNRREVITAPKGSRKSAAKEVELQAEDEQSFLNRQLYQLQAGRADAVRMSPGGQKTSERRMAGSPGMQSNISVSSSKKPDG